MCDRLRSLAVFEWCDLEEFIRVTGMVVAELSWLGVELIYFLSVAIQFSTAKMDRNTPM